MLSRDDILYTERAMNDYTEKMNRSFVQSRAKPSQANMAAHADLCRAWHRAVFQTDFLWSKETRAKLKAGDREAVHDVLLFLEVNPYYFRSGYLKERLLDAMRSTPLLEEDKKRIRLIILSACMGPIRREFSRFCSLARRVMSEDFMRQIEEGARRRDADNKGRFPYLLAYLRDPHHQGWPQN